MSRVPPSNIGRPPPPRPSRPQGQPASSRPKTTKSSAQSSSHKAHDAKNDDHSPEIKEVGQGPGDSQTGPEGDRHATGEHALFSGGQQETVDREDRLKHHEAKSEEERKEGGRKVAGSKSIVPDKNQNQKQKAGAPGKRPLNLGFETTSFESANARMQELKKAADLQKLQAPPPPRLSGGNLGDAMKALHNAKENGVFYKEEGFGGEGRPDEQAVDPELEAAVEECIRLLFGVQGILRVGPGLNDANEPVVIVVATRGFSAKSLTVVPQTVHRFKTLLALPFELLPLRRERL